MLKSQIRVLLAENRMLKNHLNANSTNDSATDSKATQDLIDELTAESIDLVELIEFIEPSDPNPNIALYLSDNENHPSVNLIDESIEMRDLSDQPDQSMMICKNEPIEQNECAEPPKINKCKFSYLFIYLIPSNIIRYIHRTTWKKKTSENTQ